MCAHRWIIIWLIIIKLMMNNLYLYPFSSLIFVFKFRLFLYTLIITSIQVVVVCFYEVVALVVLLQVNQSETMPHIERQIKSSFWLYASLTRLLFLLFFFKSTNLEKGPG